MDWVQRFIWGAATAGIVVALLGFLIVDPSAQVPTQFDLDGWTTNRNRNVSLSIFIAGHVLAATVLSVTLDQVYLPWLRWLAVALMGLLPSVTLLAIVHAA